MAYRAARIHGFGKVELGFHPPQLFVLVWREQLILGQGAYSVQC